MEKLIISTNYKRLKTFLERNEEDYSYITISNEFDEIEQLLNEKKCKKIDINKFKSKICPDFQKDYIEFISNLSHEYNSIYWWANSLSAKNTFISNFHLSLYYYFMFIKILKIKNIKNIIIISSDKDLNNALR